MKVVRKLKVKAGSHFEGDTEYPQGSTLVAPEYYLKLFPEKFEDLGPVTVPETQSATTGPVEEMKEAKPKASVAKSKSTKEEDWE
jgi:hypothetical protein